MGRRDDFEDDEALAAYGADDSDEDPDYFEAPGPQHLAENQFQAETPAAISKDDFFGAQSDEEEDEDEDAAAVNENEMEEFHHTLKAAHGFKKGARARGAKTGGRRAVGEEALSFEVKSLMGEANQAYAFGHLDKAMALVKRIIQIEAGVYAAWKILGEIFKEKGENHKCLLAWLTAAHAKPKDFELWLTCARMSLDQYGPDKKNYRDQAIYCYNRAIRAEPDNIDAIYDRALLLKETGQLHKAAEGFGMLNKLLPNDMSILREIASLYIQLKKIPQAIEYYNRSIEFFKSTGNPDKAFGWSELNILVELYMMAEEWEVAIRILKNHARWLSGRMEEKYWERLEDDREWDSHDKRRKSVREYVPMRFDPKTYTLPLELRVKLGVCRLKEDDKKEAMVHFAYLDSEDPVEYYDLFQEAGDALHSAKAYQEAIRYYSSVVEGTQFMDTKLWFNMATCYKALNQVDDAEDCYATVLEAYPNDTTAMMELASIYEVSGRKADALELVNQVIAIRKQVETAEATPDANATAEAEAPVPVPTGKEHSAFLPNQPAPRRIKKRQPGYMSEAQRLEMNARKTEQTTVKYRKLEYLRAGMEAGEPQAVKEWLDTAGELVDDFRNTRALFPSEKGILFKGFMTTARRRELNRNIKERLEMMQHRLEGSLNFLDDEIEAIAPETTIFRGLDFDTWLYIFMQYALCLAKHDNYQDAYDVCSIAKEANVFYMDKRKIFIIWTTWLACAIWVKDSESCSTISRWFMTTFQFQTEAYNLFVGALTMSRNGMEVFHNNANQKFLLRQIKIMDESIDGKKRVNAASLTNIDEHGKEFKPDRLDISLLMLYGHILASGKSYISALSAYPSNWIIHAPWLIYNVQIITREHTPSTQRTR
jgi:general transcription factor 3C polypeptide 3 (transcription factor C subunit 4)